MITYCIAAKTVDALKKDFFVREVQALDFDHAHAMLRSDARERWPEREWRATNVSEQPTVADAQALVRDCQMERQVAA